MNFKKAAVVAVTDIVILIELTLAIYIGRLEMDDFNLIFMEVFIPLAVFTIMACRKVLKRIPDEDITEEEAPAGPYRVF